MRTPGGLGPLGLAGRGGTLAAASGLVLAISSFTGWYSARTELATVAVTGWHTGTVGKLVFFAGLAVLVLLLLEQTGLELPPSFPVGAGVAALGALGTIFVVVRVIDIPDRFAGTGRSVGLWISFAAALAVVLSGLLKASDDVQSRIGEPR